MCLFLHGECRLSCGGLQEVPRGCEIGKVAAAPEFTFQQMFTFSDLLKLRIGPVESLFVRAALRSSTIGVVSFY